MKYLAAILVSLVALQGCVTNEGLTGTGPIKLTDRQQAHFKKWARGTTDRDSLYFFLVRGGKSFGVYCPDSVALCRDANEFNWKQKCDTRHGKGACKLYGVYGDVVWKFNEPADPEWSNVRRGYSVTREQAKTAVDVRPIEIKWDGHQRSLKGSLHYRSSLRRYDLTLSIPDVTYCEGTAEFTRKTWSMKCKNGVTASGTFRPLGTNKGSIGEGVDNKGNRIEFRVGPSPS